MVTEAKLKTTLKEMMKTKKLEEINVTSLCKKCNVHRQTFYYHYTDIYDLIAAIFLNEDLSLGKKPKDTHAVLTRFTTYVYRNFTFLRSTYNSAARDLTDDFIFGKLMAVLLEVWNNDPKITLSLPMIRNASRRFAHLVADEFGFCFKDPKLTPSTFRASMSSFIELAESILLPAVFEISRKEVAAREKGI